MKAVFQAEASPAIGIGHVARCRVLAEALRERGAETAEGPGEADWLVVDQYSLDAAWERAQRKRAPRILAIDDLGRSHDCDVLLDQNWFPDAWSRYDGRLPPRCRRLLGPHYALLRPEFSKAAKRIREGTVRRVLVSFGGGDAQNHTAKAVEALRGLDVDVDVTVGEKNPNGDEIARLCAGNPRITVHRPAKSMAALMEAADLAIGAGGITTWERCCLGLPAIQLAIAPNQEPPTRALAQAGFVFHAPEINPEVVKKVLANPAELKRQSAAVMQLVDGEGRRRVAAAMLARAGTAFALRDARPDDARLYFVWANDPEVRQQSFRAEPIAWAEHEPWFAQRLGSAVLLVAEERESGLPLGQVRFERADGRWTIHYSVAPEFRGVGLGGKMLSAAIAELRRRHPGARLRAAVKAGNEASLRVFGALGFREASESVFELDT